MEIKTSKTEIKDLAKALITVSLAFAILLTKEFALQELLKNIGIAAITVTLGFLFHELAHKVVAQKFGCFAEFRASNTMLLIALATSFFGFIFAAPGAVMIAGRVSKERNGKIALAGPLTNLAVAVIFLSLSQLLFLGETIKMITHYGFMINSWLALFNMLPFGFLDGKKVKAWNSKAYWATTIIAALFTFFLQI
ncbi:hypothetical protein HY643_04495 [Candidatus Woesearchaeota archaeon]|nr:hypothetical protein [Candidatus Woesearchaeota archaeon]